MKLICQNITNFVIKWLCYSILTTGIEFVGGTLGGLRLYCATERILPPSHRINLSAVGHAEPGAEAACLFLGKPGMSHAKRYTDKSVANEGWDPKTGNRVATGSATAVQ